MKLTNYLREAFVKAAMNDVPQVNYEQQCRDLVQTMRKAVLKPLGLDKADPNRLCNHTTVWMPKSMPNMTVHGLTSDEAKAIAADPKIVAFCNAHEAQKQARSELQSKLEGIASGCTTRKQLVELLPEFEKYLPADTPKPGANLPAISNVVGEFIRAGWPKDQKNASA